MGRSSSSWETMYDHHVGLLSAAMPKWPLGFIMSVLSVAPKLAASRGKVWKGGRQHWLQQVVGSAQHPPSMGEAAGSSGTGGLGSISVCLEHHVRAAKLNPCCSLSSVQAELFSAK